MRIADHDHFGIGRDGLRSEPLWRCPAEKCGRLFDPELAILDDSLQGFPNSRVDQNIAIVEHQIAAVGPADGAGLDQCEIGHVAADDWLFLNDAEEIVITRIGFYDDRRPQRFTVIHEHIHSVR